LRKSPAGGSLLKTLEDADVLAALSAAEAAKARLRAIGSLQGRIKRRALEEPVRRRLAASPWIIGPMWDAFATEKRAAAAIKRQAKKSGLSGVEGRVGHALSSGNQLLILETTGPRRRLGWDHVNLCVKYIQMIRTTPETDERFKSYHGYIIADRIDEDPALQDYVVCLQDQGITARRWSDLLDNAKAEWGEYLHILAERGKGDPRLARLVADDDAA